MGFRYCIYDKTEKLADLSLELESLGRHVCGVVWCGDLEDERLVMKLGVGKQPLVNTIRGGGSRLMSRTVWAYRKIINRCVIVE